jgi:deoxyribodipyrimidine photolyase-related protein
VGHTALIFGDQLMRDNPALAGAERVLFVESTTSLRRRRTHRRRVHIVLSGMRHFAAELREAGEFEVVERRGAATLESGLDGFGDLVCAAPNSAAARRAMRRLGVRQVDSNQFLTSPEAFATWARDRPRLVMEDFYREQRRRFGLLLDAKGKPEGGRWNWDAENRKPAPDGLQAPDPYQPVEDAIDEEVRADLDRLGIEMFGADGPRQFAVTPDEGRAALESFLDDRLAEFGPWQDAMVADERFLFHSLLSVPMNLGVLDPLTVVRAAEFRYRDGRVPLRSAEGFIRQIVGWREWVWGMYWLRATQWPERNALDAHLPLGKAYWGGQTGWRCFDSVVSGVVESGYAHHIQRLMVLGSIGLTSGVEPWELVRWFQTAFVDGAEWVMAPNAAGMALFADGGEMMTKPYAAGGNYINRMSDFCSGCRYSPSEKHGPSACPVTALYWDFVDRHAELVGGNRRTRRAVPMLARFDDATRSALAERASVARRELVEGRTLWPREEETEQHRLG